MPKLNITNLDKAEILAILYNNAKPNIVTPFTFVSPLPMTVAYAKRIIRYRMFRISGLYFDYLLGRILKIDLSQNTIDTTQYNCENGINGADAALAELRKLVKPIEIITSDYR